MTKKKAFKALKISSKPSKPSKDAPMTFADLIDDDDIFSDPHVRIVGRKDDVLRVKDKIMAVLDAKVSRQIFFLEMFSEFSFKKNNFWNFYLPKKIFLFI